LLESLMNNDREEQVRIRAYEIWERTGHLGGPEDHWFQAEVELELERPALPEHDEAQPRPETASDADQSSGPQRPEVCP
jgi:hypothetical protein